MKRIIVLLLPVLCFLTSQTLTAQQFSQSADKGLYLTSEQHLTSSGSTLGGHSGSYLFGSTIGSPFTTQTTGVMMSGSKYASTLHAIGATTAQDEASNLNKRFGGLPGKDNDKYDPTSPNFGSLTDATIFLLCLAVGFMIVLKKRKPKQIQ